MRPIARAHRLPAPAHRARAPRRGPASAATRSRRSPVNHRGEAYGYAFVEDDRPGRFDVEAARRARRRGGPGLRAPAARRDGRRRATRAGDGRDAPRAQDRDLRRHGAVPGGRGARRTSADLLVHEATFIEDERARARETGHSTARQAAEIARDAERPAARAHPPLDALLPARDPRRGARGVRRHRRPARLRRDRGAVPRARRARRWSSRSASPSRPARPPPDRRRASTRAATFRRRPFNPVP